jgi:hypothetical protein
MIEMFETLQSFSDVSFGIEKAGSYIKSKQAAGTRIPALRKCFHSTFE